MIERCISSSGLIQIALDQSSKSQIHDRLFTIREQRLASPEFDAILEKGAEQGLLGVVTEAISMAGMNVSLTISWLLQRPSNLTRRLLMVGETKDRN